MVIINDFAHTQRHKVKSNAFVSVLAVVLSLLITLSVVTVAVPIVSARGETAFQDNECIYIDCRQQLSGGNYWDSAGAELRVFTYYNDSDDPNFCHEFEENFQNNGWFVGSNVLQKGIKADKFADHIYRFRIPSDKLSHVRIARTNSGATNVWNISKYMWNNQRSFTAGSKYNCIKITGWGEGYDYNSNSWSGSADNASWTNFTPSKISSYSSKTATLDTSITSRSDLFTIDAKYYDYYNDDEIHKNWGNINYSSNHATVHYTKNNNWYWWDGYWEPFSYLNSKIAAKGGNYPLYFGNFYGKNDGYTGEGSSNLVSFNNKVNNSGNIGGNHKSIAGLTGGTLNSDKNIVYATDYGYNSDTVVPFFDDNFLSSNGVGSVISSKFPMRKVTDSTSGITTYTFNSEGATDNVWINNATGSSPTVSYGSGTSFGAKDSLYSYSDRESSGYGFFPFDSTRGTTAEAKNYGFGLRVDIPFNLGSQEGHIGQLYGTDNQWHDQIFNFTGDDDVWVYVDGKLILDLGGDHKKTEGSINFHTKEVSADISTTFNTATRNQNNFTLDNEGDPTAEHTLTMFYVERGMIESNLSFNFNFAPVANQLVTEKIVNTDELNDGIKNAYAVKNADEFTFTSSKLNGKDYTYAHTNAQGARSGSDKTVSNSKFNLRDQDTATFNDQLTVGDTINVTESFPSSNNLTYNKTSWVVVDTLDDDYVIAQSPATTTQSLNSSFVFKTHKTGQFDPTKLKLTFTNTPKHNSVELSKCVEDVNSDTTDFTGKVQLSFDGGQTWGYYPLKYTIKGGGSTKYTVNGTSGALDSRAQLRHNRTLVFDGIPVGTLFRFTETPIPNGYSYSGVDGAGNGDVVENSNGGWIKVGSGTNTSDSAANWIRISNKINSGTGSVTVHKDLDGVPYDGEDFTFVIEGQSTGKSGRTYVNQQFTKEVDSCDQGDVVFDGLTFTSPGWYSYKIYEKPLTEDQLEQGYVGDDTVMYVEFQVEASGGTLQKKAGTENFYANATMTQSLPNGETFINLSPPVPVDGTITGTKYLDDQPYTNGASFKFSLKGLEPFADDDDDVMDTSGVNKSITRTDANGKFTFTGDTDGLYFTEPGVYRYILSETTIKMSNHNGQDYQQIVGSDGDVQTDPGPGGAGYYILCESNDWDISPDYQLTENPNTGAYELKQMYLGAEDTFYIVYSSDGADFSEMYPEYGSPYGSNGEIPAEGQYTVQYNPNASGNKISIVSEGADAVKHEKFLVTITVTKNDATNELEAVTASKGYDSSDPLSKDDFVITADNASDIVFYNRQTPGSVTVTKTDQNDEAVRGVTFALYRIDAATDTALNNLTSEAARYNYIKSNLTPYKTAESDKDGIANFADLPIFEYKASTGKYDYSTYQKYRIMEYTVPEGTNLNETTLEFTFPQQDGSNNWIYDLEFGYVNGKMINPYTGYISPVATFRTIGLCVIAGALALGAFFILRRKRVFARYKKKH